jgi:hypothetical protein
MRVGFFFVPSAITDIADMLSFGHSERGRSLSDNQSVGQIDSHIDELLSFAYENMKIFYQKNRIFANAVRYGVFV